MQRRPGRGATRQRGLLRRAGAAVGLLAFAMLAVGSLSSASAAVPGHGRAWELITPPDPISASVVQTEAVAPGGDRLLYTSFGPLPGASGGGLFAWNLMVREPSGWRVEPIGNPYLVGKTTGGTLWGPVILGFDEGLSTFLFKSSSPLLPSAPAEPRIGVYRQAAGGPLSVIADLELIGGLTGMSDDTSHLVFASWDHLLPSDAVRTEGRSLYELTSTGLRQVDVDDAGNALSACGSDPAYIGSEQEVPGWVSDSGERIFFRHSAITASCSQTRIYLRESHSKTVEVSASHCTRVDCNEASDVSFLGATPSGSVAFIVTQQQLTNDDLNERRDLYRFDTATEQLSLVSPGSAGTEGAVEERSVLLSEDGSRVYFYAYGELLPGQGTDEMPGLYLADSGGLHLLDQTGATAQITADGRIALVTTATALEAGDTDGMVDLYRYDAAASSWLRLSKGPAGGNGPFDVFLPDDRALTAGGQRYFFETDEALLPEDHNEALDVYEWSGGQLGLVSSGEGSDPAEFEGVSPDGVTAVVRTQASLLRRDRDGGDFDLYAARIGGGFDETEPPPPTCAGCAGGESARLDRPEAPTAAVRSQRRGKLLLRKVRKNLAREVARTGSATLQLSVPAPGRVSAAARGRLGGKSRVLARGVAGAIRPGRLRLQLTMSKPARQVLIAGRTLALKLVVQQPPQRLERTLSLELGGAK
jgi:hypothetical protein